MPERIKTFGAEAITKMAARSGSSFNNNLTKKKPSQVYETVQRCIKKETARPGSPVSYIITKKETVPGL